MTDRRILMCSGIVVILLALLLSAAEAYFDKYGTALALGAGGLIVGMIMVGMSNDFRG